PIETFIVHVSAVYYKLHVIADSHLYKQTGNSVVIPVVERIAKDIELAIENTSSKKEETLKEYAVTYTNMIGSNVGKSYVIKNFNTLAKAQQFVKESNITLVTDDRKSVV